MGLAIIFLIGLNVFCFIPLQSATRDIFFYYKAHHIIFLHKILQAFNIAYRTTSTFISIISKSLHDLASDHLFSSVSYQVPHPSGAINSFSKLLAIPWTAMFLFFGSLYMQNIEDSLMNSYLSFKTKFNISQTFSDSFELYHLYLLHALNTSCFTDICIFKTCLIFLLDF